MVNVRNDEITITPKFIDARFPSHGDHVTTLLEKYNNKSMTKKKKKRHASDVELRKPVEK